MPNAYRVRSRIPDDGTLVLKDLPFRAGEEVEIIVLSGAGEEGEGRAEGERYPLHGTPLRFEDPFSPLPESDWQALEGSSSTPTSGSGGSTETTGSRPNGSGRSGSTRARGWA